MSNVNTVTYAFENMWAQLASYVPNILSAVVVLIIGLLLAGSLSKLAKKIIQLIHVDDLLAKTGLTQKAQASGITFSLAGIIGWLVKWFLVLVVLIATADILGWPQVTQFLSSVALYLPNVIIAVVIMTVGVILGHFLHSAVEKGIAATRTSAAAKPLAAVAKWAVIVFAIMAALLQLGIAERLIEILFTGLVAMLALAGGLAFGLGGRERAARWLESLEREIGK